MNKFILISLFISTTLQANTISKPAKIDKVVNLTLNCESTFISEDFDISNGVSLGENTNIVQSDVSRKVYYAGNSEYIESRAVNKSEYRVQESLSVKLITREKDNAHELVNTKTQGHTVIKYTNSDKEPEVRSFVENALELFSIVGSTKYLQSYEYNGEKQETRGQIETTTQIDDKTKLIVTTEATPYVEEYKFDGTTFRSIVKKVETKCTETTLN